MVSQPNTLLQHIGIILVGNFCATITVIIVQGVFVLLFFIGTALLLRRGLGSRSTQAMLSVAVLSFIMATVNCATSTAFTITQVREVMMKNLEMPLDERMDVTNYKTIQTLLVGEWVGTLMPIIADSVVIWRAWVIFFENRLAMIGPLLLLLGTFATTLTTLALDSDVESAIESAQDVLTLSNKFFMSTLALSLATNALATIMVGYKLWAHRTLLARMLGLEQRFTRAQNVLAIIVESGMFYFALQLTNIILTLSPSGASIGSAESFAALVFHVVYVQLSAMYPLIVVVLVNHQRSFIDTCGFTSVDCNSTQIHGQNVSAHPSTAGHLSFAPPAATKMESLGSWNITMKDKTDAELGVLERHVEHVNVDVNMEKRQANTAPF